MARFVVVGDSLSQGFQSGAITNTLLSYPAMVAKVLGLRPTMDASPNPDAFRVPDFTGEGGLPANLELVLRDVQPLGKIDFWEWPIVFAKGYMVLNRGEAYWEDGPGAGPSASGSSHHNLSVWGFSVSDSWMVTEGMCRRELLGVHKGPDFAPMPSQAMYRTARRTLNPGLTPAEDDLSQLARVERIADEEGGIENLFFWLGANNVLGTTFALDLKWSQSSDVHKLPHQRHCNIWTAEHFAILWRKLEARLRKLKDDGKVERIFIGTVPDVTIPPITRGVSPSAIKARGEIKRKHPNATPEELEKLYVADGACSDKSSDGLFEYYTHFWIWDDDFVKDPPKHPHITRDEARQIRSVIHEYNDLIKASAEANGWHVIDIAELLADLAYRRNGGQTKVELPAGLVKALKKNPKTKDRFDKDGKPIIDTRFLGQVEVDGKMECRGGIFALDGVHPTTVGYGIVADKVLQVMQTAQVDGADPTQLDWDEIVAADTLLNDFPPALEDLKEFLGHADPLLRRVMTALRDDAGRG